MNSSTHEVALAGAIALRGVHAYLSANGWIRDESLSRDTTDIYVWSKDQREAAIVPASEGYGDYITRIWQIGVQLSRLEGRPTHSVLTDLSLADSDLVRVRLPNANDDNTVRLTDGAAVLDEAKSLLLAAACSADRPQRMYRAGRNRRAADYLSKVRLGQTEPGSFVINLLSPVSPCLTERHSWFPEEPFERRVTRKLVSGLCASRRAIDRVNRGSADIGEFENGLDEGISANLCRSAARLTEVGRGLEVAVSWAMTRPYGPDVLGRTAVDFRPPDVAVLEEAARVLSDRQERTNEEIQGPVVRLKRAKADAKGTATIRAFVDGRLASVQAVFDPSDYEKITRAHQNRRSVSLEGDLHRKGQRWHLRNPRGVTILRDEDS